MHVTVDNGWEEPLDIMSFGDEDYHDLETEEASQRNGTADSMVMSA